MQQTLNPPYFTEAMNEMPEETEMEITRILNEISDIDRKTIAFHAATVAQKGWINS